MPSQRLGPSGCVVLCALSVYVLAPGSGAATALAPGLVPAGGAAHAPDASRSFGSSPVSSGDAAHAPDASRSVGSIPISSGGAAHAPDASRSFGSSPVSSGDAAHAPDAPLRVRLGGPGSPVTEVPLEEYVRGAVHTEVSLGGLPRDAALRMAEVQSILARTYALANRHRHETEGFDLCATTHCQVFRTAPSDRADIESLVADAVERTRGLVVVHQGEVVNALFHADCGGATSAAETVWGGHTPPYLRGVDDPYCRKRPARPWSVTLAASEAHEALNRHPHTHVGDTLRGIEVTERDAAGRAVRIRIDGERTLSVRGETFRTALMRTLGPRAVRSTRLEIRHVGGEYVLSGTGYGHGVGVCQIGALAQARAGRAAADILAHYYPETSVVPLRGGG